MTDLLEALIACEAILSQLPPTEPIQAALTKASQAIKRRTEACCDLTDLFSAESHEVEQGSKPCPDCGRALDFIEEAEASIDEQKLVFACHCCNSFIYIIKELP